MGDSFLIMVTVTPVNCELDDTQIGMALGGGLTGDGLHQIGYNYGADTPISIRVGAQAVQAGTWTYTAVAGGWSYGTVDPQDGSCATDAREAGVATGRTRPT